MGLKDYWGIEFWRSSSFRQPEENIRHQNVLDRNSEYLWELMEYLWGCKEYLWECKEYLWECEKDLMSTGTSSTFAKVDLILSLTTPYFANNLDLKLGHRRQTCIFVGTLSRSAQNRYWVKSKVWWWIKLLFDRLLVPRVLHSNIFLDSILHRVL